MCTVTYLPKSNNEYILTSSRDEATARPSAVLPKEYSIDGKIIIFPKDPVGGGSWIAYSESRTACLLNGAFKKHKHNPPYKKSRGLVLLDYFSFADLNTFTSNYNFSKIEPFTLVIIEPLGLFELRWDGAQTFIEKLDSNKPLIWSSSTLYSDEIISKRKTWFSSWLNSNPKYSTEGIRSFHTLGGEGDKENDFLMNRNNLLLTISLTSVVKKTSGIEMVYEDLTNKSSIIIALTPA